MKGVNFGHFNLVSINCRVLFLHYVMNLLFYLKKLSDPSKRLSIKVNQLINTGQSYQILVKEGKGFGKRAAPHRVTFLGVLKPPLPGDFKHQIKIIVMKYLCTV